MILLAKLFILLNQVTLWFLEFRDPRGRVGQGAGTKALILATVVALAVAVPTQRVEAGEFTSAMDLFAACQGLKGSNDAEKFMWLSVCTGYIDGITDISGLSSALPLRDRVLCLPVAGISVDTAIKVVLLHIARNPTEPSARIATKAALVAKYPCSTTKRRKASVTDPECRSGSYAQRLKCVHDAIDATMAYGSTIVDNYLKTGTIGTAPFSSTNIVYVRGYFRRNGTYVQQHYRTEPDRTIQNNWSTKGNVNPFTGRHGYRTR